MVSNAFFFQRLNDHIQYLKKVQGAIEDKNKFQGTDPHHCKLGEWLYGSGPEEAAQISQEARVIFDEFSSPMSASTTPAPTPLKNMPPAMKRAVART